MSVRAKIAAHRGKAKAPKLHTPSYGQQPVVPGSPLTNQGLARETAGAVKTQYGPQEQALRQQIQASQRLQAQIPGWYQQYLDAVNQSRTDQAARQATAVAQINGLANSADQSSAQMTASQVQGLNADAQTRGATAATPALQTTANQASGVRRMLTDSFGGRLVANDTAQGQYLNALGTAGVGSKILALQNEQGRQRGIQEKQTALKGQEGAYANQYSSKRRSDELNNVATAQLAGGNLAVKQAQVGIAQENAKTNRIKATKAPPDAPGPYGYTKKEWLGLPEAQRIKITQANKKKAAANGGKSTPTAGPGSLSPSQEAKLASQVNRIYGFLRDPVQPVKNPTTGQVTYQKLSGAALQNYLASQNLDPNILAVARDLAANGDALSEAGITAAHRLGLHVSGHWRIAPSHKPVSGAAPVAPGPGGGGQRPT